MTSGTPSHRAAAPDRVRVAVLTVSDTRTRDTDASGSYLRESLQAGGHEVAAYAIVKDEPAAIEAQLRAWLADPTVQAVITTGGTGITRRDGTVEVVERLLEKPLPGFGEVFRMLSYGQVRGAAILSRATAGVTQGTLVFALPGSLNAVQTAWEGILRDDLAHFVHELVR
ncbi:MAG TPA: MogA/MoaB family molybdenum cofactor biosynthesis protein [Deinococcales bacterium]|nr:MogA/MoaB family molybdenum cofactor biosynthesis protein [Deinococcales bacterium]